MHFLTPKHFSSLIDPCQIVQACFVARAFLTLAEIPVMTPVAARSIRAERWQMQGEHAFSYQRCIFVFAIGGRFAVVRTVANNGL